MDLQSKLGDKWPIIKARIGSNWDKFEEIYIGTEMVSELDKFYTWDKGCDVSGMEPRSKIENGAKIGI